MVYYTTPEVCKTPTLATSSSCLVVQVQLTEVELEGTYISCWGQKGKVGGTGRDTEVFVRRPRVRGVGAVGSVGYRIVGSTFETSKRRT